MNIPCLFCYALPIVLTVTSAWSAPLLSPQEALKKMEVPEGFQVDLLAAEPDLVSNRPGKHPVVLGIEPPAQA